MDRTANIERNTLETKIRIALNLDCGKTSAISTGIGFFDHMLTALAKHSGIGLEVSCQGDLVVDGHHTMEDVGIALGSALKDALGEKRGINRFGFFLAPLDESLARAVIDLSGRPHLSWRGELPQESINGVNCRLHREFFQGLVNACGMTLHIDLLACEESHHGLEAIYKAFARALRVAIAPSGNANEIPSTKGTL